MELEWVGVKSSLEGSRLTRGATVTSADALMVADTRSGVRRGYVIEWKYVEEYRVGEFKGTGEAGNTRRERYQALYDGSDSPFNRSVPLDAWLYEPFYQILRLHLLAAKIVREDELKLGMTEARVVVVCPEANRDFRERMTSPELARPFPTARNVQDVVRAALKQPDKFVLTSPEILLAAARTGGLPSALAPWSEYMQARYGW